MLFRQVMSTCSPRLLHPVASPVATSKSASHPASNFTMNFFSTLLALGQGIAFAHAASCNADNCARAVTGLQRGSAAYATAQADCASFFQATATPCTSTSTVYVFIFPSTIISTVIASTETDVTTVYPSTETDLTTVATILVRTIAPLCSTSTSLPSSVPKYASACSGTARYSSACSCFGATQTTVFTLTHLV